MPLHLHIESRIIDLQVVLQMKAIPFFIRIINGGSFLRERTG
jgi:hypothetical protein